MVQKLALLGREMFSAASFDCRPDGGTAAAQAVLQGCCSRGDGFMHFAVSDGGQAGLDSMAAKLGIETFKLPLQPDTLLVDINRVALQVHENPHIRLVLLDQSSQLRCQPLAEIRAALPGNIILAYDASQDGALILGGVVPQPLLSGADILLGNTHDNIPGPLKGYIAFADVADAADSKVSALLKGLHSDPPPASCHAESIAPFYLALVEMQIFARPYAELAVRNAKALAAGLYAEGLNVSGRSFGFTETHQVHLGIGSADGALRTAADSLSRAGIRCDAIEMPGSAGQQGLRFGVQALTRRGVDEAGMAHIARLIVDVVLRRERSDSVRHEVCTFLRGHPLQLLHFSLDEHYGAPYGQRLREESNA